MLVGIEINRDFGCALWRHLEAAQKWNLVKQRQACRRELELDLAFLSWRQRGFMRRAISQIDRQRDSGVSKMATK